MLFLVVIIGLVLLVFGRIGENQNMERVEALNITQEIGMPMFFIGAPILTVIIIGASFERWWNVRH